MKPSAPVIAGHEQPVGFDDRLALAVDERLGCEVVDVMDGPHDGDRRAGVAEPHGRARGDAVLRMQDVEVVGQCGQSTLECVDRVGHPLFQRVGPRRCGDKVARRPHVPEERVAECDHRHGRPACTERLGERQGVHHAAPRLGGVRDQCDARTHSGARTRRALPVATAAAASEARAAVSVTMQPAWTSASRWALSRCGSCSVPST